jgi:uncharacterized protein YndB with AHSA1/START domain
VESEHIAIDIAAAPERVWQVIVDIDSWPQWTESVTEVKRLDSGPLQVGSRARLKQPGLLPLVWELTELQPGTQFTWVNRFPGVTSTSRHEIIASGDGSRLAVTTTWSGPLAGLITALNRTRTRRLLAAEANGAKARSERTLPPCSNSASTRRLPDLSPGTEARSASAHRLGCPRRRGSRRSCRRGA